MPNITYSIEFDILKWKMPQNKYFAKQTCKRHKIKFYAIFSQNTNIIQNRSTFDMKCMSFLWRNKQNIKKYPYQNSQKLIFVGKTAKFPQNTVLAKHIDLITFVKNC